MKAVNSVVKGKEYLYWSEVKNKHETVVYCGQRRTPAGKMLYVFRNMTTLNEVWTETLQNVSSVQ